MAAAKISNHSEESDCAVFAGAMPLDSAFYVERSPIETDCYTTILKPGALIRIKGFRQLGKTSLLLRILHQAAQNGYQTVGLNLWDIEATMLQDLDRFLAWFCTQITCALQLPDRLADYWDDLFGSVISCKSYFEEYLLVQTPQPLVLALDDVDRLFAYPDLADEFFGLLRAWHEESKSRAIWQRLRLVIAHASEVYIPLNIHKSPFNVGLPIELNRLTLEQVQDLAKRHGFTGTTEVTEALRTFVGGHPHLVQLTLHALTQHPLIQDTDSLNTLLRSATMYSVFHHHLQQQTQVLDHDPTLAATFTQVLQSPTPVELELPQALKLQSLGLITLQGTQATPSCALYAWFFGDRLHQSGTV